MIVTIDWLEYKYNIFNKLYFNNELPKISFKISRSKNTWGYAGCLIINSTIVPEYISISNYYDSPEIVKESTLLHEMIHVKDYVCHPEHFIINGRRNRWYDAHGTWFKNEALKLAKYGYDIQKLVTKEEIDISTYSDSTICNLERKKDTTRILAIYGKNDKIWFCKTSENNIENILNNVKTCIWWFNQYLNGINNITIFSTNSKHYIERRSCNKKLTGWILDNSMFENESLKNNFEFIRKIDY